MEVSLDELCSALERNRIIAFDFETSSVRPKEAIVAGLGIYLPSEERAFYINVGHGIVHAGIPRYSEQELVNAIGPFFLNPKNHAVAHNATYDLRMLFRIGVQVRCRVTCTMILTHRLDENLRCFGRNLSTHYHIDRVTYGLKELTQLYFRQKPPTLRGTIGSKNAINASPKDVGQYCCQDCVNTFNLFLLAGQRLGCPLDSTNCDTSNGDQRTIWNLVRVIDDPNNLVLAKMLWQGIKIDRDEISRQRIGLERSIQDCRNAIWQLTGSRSPLDAPRDQLSILRKLKLSFYLDYDPFWDSFENAEEEGESNRLALIDIIEDLEVIRQGSIDSEDIHVCQKVIALFLSMNQMKQRINAFLNPLSERSRDHDSKLYANRFDSMLATTRFSSSPNLQNLPGRADKTNDYWMQIVPENCLEQTKTRNLFTASEDHRFVSIDLKAAEPRYMALLFQRALQNGDSDYQARRKTASLERLSKYGELIDRMRSLQDKPKHSAYEIKWPEIDIDPLWRVFHDGVPTNDPYNALLIAMDRDAYEYANRNGTAPQWFKENRWRGKKAFLAFAYGAGAESLAPQLGWSIERTKEAIASIEATYCTLKPLRNLTMLELTHLGQVQNLWGRPRRINGYYQLAQCKPVKIGFYRMKPSYRSYIAKIIPLGSTSPAPNEHDVLIGGGGVQAFVEECFVEHDDGDKLELVLAGNSDGTIRHISRGDPFANAHHFNKPPFRNINFNQIRWVEDEFGVRRHLERQGTAFRAAFNSLCQSTGADHLRWIMNSIDQELCSTPEFLDCHLVLTVHDSLVFEVPDSKVAAFVSRAVEIASRRPVWSSIDMSVDVETGRRYGEMATWQPPSA